MLMNWTDQRLDDLANRVDAGFEQVGSDMRDLRTELKGDIAKVETKLESKIDTLDAKVDRLDAKFDVKFDRQQLLLIQLFVGFFFALIGADAVGLIGG
jgi:hypothetical protein